MVQKSLIISWLALWESIWYMGFRMHYRRISWWTANVSRL